MLSEYDKALLDAALDKLGINSAYECLTRCDYDMTIRDAWLSCDRTEADYDAIMLAGQIVRACFERVSLA